jgi:hypothetical protein
LGTSRHTNLVWGVAGAVRAHFSGVGSSTTTAGGFHVATVCGSPLFT